MGVTFIDMLPPLSGQKTSEGYTFFREGVVENPTPQSGSTITSRIFEALNDAEMPDIGDAHPAVAAVKLDQIRCTAVEANWFRFELRYRTPNARHFRPSTADPAKISMEASLIQLETTKRLNGGSDFSPLSYTYKSGARDPRNLDETLDADYLSQSEIPLVPVYIPTRIYTVTKIKNDLDEDELEALNDTYQGTINSISWRGYDAKTWLCLGITFRSTDLAGTFEVRFQFQYQPDDFDVHVTFVDPHTGKVPGDVENGATQPNAAADYQVQPTADFNDLDDEWS